MSDTTANGKTILHKGDRLKHVAMAPDVCKTPSPGGPVPVPYPNVAKSSDLAKGTKSVTIEGTPAGIASSHIRTSSGDEAGTAGGGIISGKTKGTLKWLRFSLDVKFEGKGVVRHLDEGLHNGNANNTYGKLQGGTYPGKALEEQDILCDNCGQSINSAGHVQLKPSSSASQAADAANDHTAAAVVIEGVKKPFLGKAGDQRSFVLNTNNFKDLAKNFKSGKKIEPWSETDRFRAGNCAEQKALFAAFKSGNLQIPPGDGVNLSVLQQEGGGKKLVESCRTCKRVLASMMCTNDPPEKKGKK
ncbi:DUF4150 domain-containing protein [Nannocystis sp. RBIL2]|uniref:DUF4150 domain-containing protein n=1 Tax=Nannocystis sp. RBIL2 TaxID=2996788 RepID=UPI0022702151|nr:DUF4150 domain-containing protein [Nannocystis sp. RBIL2]MCY1071181.1 DUF4150 domain-containing protein [Nannocystis sp. RBIL2]